MGCRFLLQYRQKTRTNISLTTISESFGAHLVTVLCHDIRASHRSSCCSLTQHLASSCTQLRPSAWSVVPSPPLARCQNQAPLYPLPAASSGSDGNTFSSIAPSLCVYTWAQCGLLQGQTTPSLLLYPSRLLIPIGTQDIFVQWMEGLKPLPEIRRQREIKDKDCSKDNFAVGKSGSETLSFNSLVLGLPCCSIG